MTSTKGGQYSSRRALKGVARMYDSCYSTTALSFVIITCFLRTILRQILQRYLTRHTDYCSPIFSRSPHHTRMYIIHCHCDFVQLRLVSSRLVVLLSAEIIHLQVENMVQIETFFIALVCLHHPPAFHNNQGQECW